MLSFSEAHQLLKIPVLMQHYKEHKKENPRISFMAFLKMHYSGIFVVDSDYSRDNQLPFRTADCLSFTVNFDFPPQQEWKPEISECCKEYGSPNERQMPFIPLSDIFQPPRFA